MLDLAKSLDQSEWAPRVAVFYEGELAQRLRQVQIPVTLLAPAKLSALAGIVPVRKLIREWRPAIVHTHGVRANLSGRLANKAEGSPARVITTIHSLLPLDYPVAWKRILFGCFEKWTWPYTDHFIAVSRTMLDWLLQEGLPRDRTSVIHNAIQLPPVLPRRPEYSALREELGLPQHAILVGTVARLHKVKGHTYLMQAVRKLKEERPDVHYVWVGGGEMEQELREQVRRNGLQDVIHFLGVRQDVPELLPQFDLFVLPSVYEGFGLAALEAMLAGVPVIASAVGGLLEVIEDGHDGLLVPPKNAEALYQALKRALSAPEQMEQMARAAQQKVLEQNSLPRLVRETTGLYRKILNG